MSQFIEATEGVYLRKQDIQAIIDNKGSSRIYLSCGETIDISANALQILEILDKEAKAEKEVEKLTQQYYGG